MKHYLITVSITALYIFALSGLFNFSHAENIANFDWFTYEGHDKIFDGKLAPDHFFNPVIAGYYPDPSIVRVDDDYYLVNSSFAYFPGLPIFHSKDLVHWQQIGHAFNTRSQLTFEAGQSMSHGIFAPTLRYHDGLFYIITTDVHGLGNFYITAKNPAGPWSEPVLLPEIGGIDPDLFFDDDGRVYIAHNSSPEGKPLYQGHRAIWLWEFDLKKKKVIKSSGRVIVNGGADITKKPIWVEGPHIYKVNGWYYLTCAEGGTEDNHSQVIFRAKQLTDKFVPYQHNPILTQRDLPAHRANPVTSAGHADFVQTPAGDWWAVFLGVRPYTNTEDKRQYHNTGRETFLLPISWNDGWPRILNAGARIPYQVPLPEIGKRSHTPFPPQSGNFKWRDDFASEKLSLNWVSLRTSPRQWFEVDKKRALLTLHAQTQHLKDRTQPSYLGRRQQHQNFRASTKLVAINNEAVSSGLALFQNADYHYFLGVNRQGENYVLFLEQTLAGKTSQVQQIALNAQKIGDIVLGAKQNAGRLSFFYLDRLGREQIFVDDIPASNLSTQKAGGFVGVTIGVHARLAKPPTETET